MARYLLVAHQTAECEELLDAAAGLANDDPFAEFVLLVPATPVVNLLVWEEGETQEVARNKAAAARARLEAKGLRVVDARHGDADPLAAIADEMHAGNGYSAIVVSTLPAGISRWLRMDILSRLHRHFPGHRLVHVEARTPVASSVR
jgi:nucleotide-binding universal stress UspA family protein